MACQKDVEMSDFSSFVDNGWQLRYTGKASKTLTHHAAQKRGGAEKENQIRMESESRDLLTVEQAAAYLQLSQSSIRSYIRQGKLNAFRIAGKRKVLIPRTELLKLLEPARAQDVDLELAAGPDAGDEA